MPRDPQHLGDTDPAGVRAVRWMALACAVGCALFAMLSVATPAQAATLAAIGVLWVLIARAL